MNNYEYAFESNRTNTMNDKFNSDLEKFQSTINASSGVAGFDFQFYYFLYCLLELKTGEEVGFEDKEDVHVTRHDGNITLIQVKHTTIENTKGEKINLTDSDDDLWKTIYNWVVFINKSEDGRDFLNYHNFILYTNKSIAKKSLASKFGDNKMKNEAILEMKKILKTSTSNNTIKYVSSFLELNSDIQNLFFEKIEIVSDKEIIIEKVKNKVKESLRGSAFYIEAYQKLVASILEDKYLDLTIRKKMNISYTDFTEKYRNCFERAYMKGALAMPDRELNIIYPFDLTSQNFIKQLIGIEFIQKNNEKKIKDMTRIMLSFLNCVNYWKENNLIVSEDVVRLYEDTEYMWEIDFDDKFGEIQRLIGDNLEKRDSKLDEQINNIARSLFNSIRRLKVCIQDKEELSLQLSNGCFYYLSDILKIGWHYDWEELYK